MVISEDNFDNKPVVKYEEKANEKGRTILKPTFLKQTPDEEIQRLNESFTDWKKYKQS